jgi:hypothetical protein
MRPVAYGAGDAEARRALDTAAAELARGLLLKKRDAVFAELSEKLGINVGMEEIGRTKWLADTFDLQGIAYPRTEKGHPSFTAGNSGWMHKHEHWLPRLIVKADRYNNAAVNVLETYILGHVVNGRIHAEIHPHRSDAGGTRSLRLSYSNPPLQLMPSHDEEMAPLIRGVFLPEEGEVWASTDFSQQEFRFIAHCAVKLGLTKAAEAAERYRADPNTDFHQFVADITGLDRQTAKAVNFAKAFGAGVKKFAAMIGKSEGEARACFERYDREMPFVAQLAKHCEKAVRKKGHLKLIDGARRHFDHWAPNGTWEKGAGPCPRNEALERVRDPDHPWHGKTLHRVDIHKAMNALHSGICCASHEAVDASLLARDGIVPLLQMHDALECSVTSEAQAERIACLGREAVSLEVPIQTDLKFGRNWGDAEHGWAELHGTSLNGSHVAGEVTRSTITAPMEEEAVQSESEPEPTHICARCRKPPDGTERRSAYNGLWLHRTCEDELLEERLAEEGIRLAPEAKPPEATPPPKPEPVPAPRPAPNGDYSRGENPGGSSVAAYIYRDAQGVPVMKVVRTAAKQFPTYHWNGSAWVKGWPKVLVPYRLPTLLAAPVDALVLICEGEKDVETGIAQGFVCTSSPGGAGKWRSEFAAYFKGRPRVCIVEDNDDAGRRHSADILESLRGIVPELGVLRFPELESGGDLSDYFAAGGSKAYLEKRIADAMQKGAEATEVIEPIDLWGRFDPPPLPNGLLPEVIEQFALEEGELMGADPRGLALSALCVCAAAIPDHVQLKVKRHDSNWLESTRLWGALVGYPSTKKTPIMLRATKTLKRIDAKMCRDYLEELENYNELEREERKGIDKPKQRRLRLEDTTIEGAQEVLKDSPDGVLCIQDELAGWFGAMDKYSGKGAAKDRAFWLQAFNGGSYAINRIQRGVIMIENLSISLLGGIQPDPMRTVAADSSDDGLMQRLIPILLAPGTPDKEPAKYGAGARYDALIERLHELRCPPAPLQFDDDALAVREELVRKHIDLMACEIANKKLAAHIGKYDGIFARLCLLWHCIEGHKGSFVSEPTARRVADFMHRFLLPHAVAFYTDMLELSEDHERLIKVAGYILTKKPTHLTNRDVQRGCSAMRGLRRQETDAVFEQLEALGWIIRTPGKRWSDPPQLHVNPEVHHRFTERTAQETAERAEVREKMLKLVKDRGAK